ncbi:MAG: TolB family protein, partial [Actinomycetota bacterium]
VDDLYPTASPDGEQIAFTSEVRGLWQVFTINTDGSGLKQLTSDNTLSAYPAWSYDGDYIFYERREGDIWEMYRVNVENLNTKRLTFNSEAFDWHPATHPFRPLVLFESGTKEDIKIMDYNGENISYITKDGNRNRVPDISSNGQIIVFSKYLGSKAEVMIMDMNGAMLAQVTHMGGTNTHPTISPDGKYIGFDSNVSGRDQIYLYSFEDGSIINVFNDPNANYKDPFFVYN